MEAAQMMPSGVGQGSMFDTPVTAYFYPDGTPVTTCDGRAKHDDVHVSWAALRASPGTNSALSGYLIVDIISGTASNTWRDIYRSFILFDTSSIPAGSVVTAASVSLYYASSHQYLGLPYFGCVVVSSNPASDTNIIAADFATVGDVALSNWLTLAQIKAAGGGRQEHFILNAAGREAINCGGITKLALRDYYYDLMGNTPPWLHLKQDVMYFHSAERPSEGERPMLKVVYKPLL